MGINKDPNTITEDQKIQHIMSRIDPTQIAVTLKFVNTSLNYFPGNLDAYHVFRDQHGRYWYKHTYHEMNTDLEKHFEESQWVLVQPDVLKVVTDDLDRRNELLSVLSKLEYLKEEKEKAIKSQNYQIAGEIRDQELVINTKYLDEERIHLTSSQNIEYLKNLLK